jgi:hypothetical protein
MTPEMWEKARKHARDYYRKNYYHPSGRAAELALESAAKKYGIDHSGIEGWALGMHSGVSYLNMGDTYETTLFAITRDRYDVQFKATCLGDLLDKKPGLAPKDD